MNKYIYVVLAIVSLNLAAGETIIFEKKIHADSVGSLCVKGNKIISVSFDGSIKKTIDDESESIGEHKDWVRKVICIDSNIITASNDGVIAIWKDSKKVNSVLAHSWWVTDIDFSKNKIVSVSLDETVKVWSYPNLELLYSHKIYGSNKHYTVIINNNKAFIGSTHGLMYVLDIDSFKWLEQKEIADRYSVPISSTKSDNNIFFGASDGTLIKVIASAPFDIFQKKISEFPLKSITQSQGYLYVGDSNGVLRKINMEDFNEFSIINHSSEAIRAIDISNDSIYAGYDDGYIRIFNNRAKK